MIRLIHLDLVITGISIQETEVLATRGGVDHPLDARQWERVFWTCLVEVGAVDAHSPGHVLFPDHNGLGRPLWVGDLPGEAGI